MDNNNYSLLLEEIRKLRSDLINDSMDVETTLKSRIGNYLARIEELEKRVKQLEGKST